MESLMLRLESSRIPAKFHTDFANGTCLQAAWALLPWRHHFVHLMKSSNPTGTAGAMFALP